jgi:predicted transcriptional regulator
MEMSSFAKFFSQKRGQVRGQRKAIEEVLKAGPATVTKISEETEFDKNLVVWNLMGMLRWGAVEIKGEENHELIYSLKEV